MRQAGLAFVLWGALAWGGFTAWRYVSYLADYPYQLEVREGAQLRSALALAEGRNPWSPAFAVQDYNCYGVLQPLAVAKFLPGGWLSLPDLRRINLGMLGLAALLVGWMVHRSTGSMLAGAGAALASVGGYLFYVTPTARCDAFAALFFIAPLACLALWPGRFGLAVAVILAALAFFAKPYAAFAGPLLALVLAGEGRWKAAMTCGGAWALMLATLLLGVQQLWPGYLETTAWLHANASQRDFDHLVLQTRDYTLHSAWPLLLLAPFGLVRFRQERQWLAWSLPALAVLALLSGWLGWHRGAFLQYYFQMLHPAALVGVAALWRARDKDHRWLEAGLVLCAWLSVSSGTLFMQRFADVDLKPWRQAEGLVAVSQRPLLPPLLTSVGTKLGKPVVDNGQTEYLALAGHGPSGPAIHQAFAEHRATLDRRLAHGSYDIVFSDIKHPIKESLLTGYTRRGGLCLPEILALEPELTCYDVYAPKARGRASVR